jgi:hypothetical protein
MWAHSLDCGRAWLRKAFHSAPEELLTVFLELERVIHEFAVDLISQ